MDERPFIVGIGGTTRPQSSGERVVRAVLAATERQGAQTQMFPGDQLAAFPHFEPGSAVRTAGQVAFVEAVRRADGFVIGTPGYHGGVSGLVKNAIDLLEDLATDTRPYFDGRAVGLVVTAAGWQGAVVTLQALRNVIHAMRGWPTPLGIAVNTVEQRPFNEAGELVDEAVKRQVEIQAGQIMMLARQGGD
jgi:FMN reductase